MSRKRISPKAAEGIKRQLADIIQNTFDKNGQFISAEDLAREHVRVNASTRAEADVAQYGGPAVIFLRKEQDYAIVPVTVQIGAFMAATTPDDKLVADTVAGLGAGGPRVGWYQPTGVDDPLWLAYVGHLALSGTAGVYWSGKQVDGNPALTSGAGVGKIAAVATTLPKPPGKAEKALLKADIGR